MFDSRRIESKIDSIFIPKSWFIMLFEQPTIHIHFSSPIPHEGSNPWISTNIIVVDRRSRSFSGIRTGTSPTAPISSLRWIASSLNSVPPLRGRLWAPEKRFRKQIRQFALPHSGWAAGVHQGKAYHERSAHRAGAGQAVRQWHLNSLDILLYCRTASIVST